MIRTPNRNRLKKHLSKKGIETLIHYPIAPNKQEAYKTFNYLDFNVTEKISKEILSLPISPVMNDEEVSNVVSSINSFNKLNVI